MDPLIMGKIPKDMLTHYYIFIHILFPESNDLKIDLIYDKIRK